MRNEIDTSPDIVEGTSKFSSGGSRLNRVPLLFLSLVLLIAISAIFYAYQQRVNQVNSSKEHKEQQDMSASSASSDSMFQNAPSQGVIPPKKNEPPVPLQRGFESDKMVISDNRSLPQLENHELSLEHRKAWEIYEQQKQRIQQQKNTQFESALIADTTVFGNKNNSQIASQSANNATLATAPDKQISLNGLGGTGNQEGTQNETWLASRSSANNPYLNSRKMPAISKFEVKAGTIIPGVMETGIISDLPGTITARVRENVYDTATGEHLLIRQGARLVGEYNSRVSQGQKRVFTGWQRIIYDDGSSIDIGRMAGADQAGNSGFNDQVNSHYWENIGNALMLSIFSAGVQLSQPQATAGQNINNQQVISASIGQQLGELGTQYARKGLNTAPTLEIRPGYKFNIVVTKDIILEPLGAK